MQILEGHYFRVHAQCTKVNHLINATSWCFRLYIQPRIQTSLYFLPAAVGKRTGSISSHGLTKRPEIESRERATLESFFG